MTTDNKPQRPRRHNNTSTQARTAYKTRAYDSIQIFVAKGSKDAIKTAAAESGVSMSAYITAAINAYAGREIVPPLQTNPYI